MKKTLNILLIIVFSITTYNSDFYVYSNGQELVNLGYLLSLVCLIVQIIAFLVRDKFEIISEAFIVGILKKYGYGTDQPIKFKGRISESKQFFSSESDSKVENVKFFCCRVEHASLHDFSDSMVGLKRRTVLYNDYHKAAGPDSTSGYSISKVFFVIRQIKSRKLLSFDIKENKVAYEEKVTKTIIEVYYNKD